MAFNFNSAKDLLRRAASALRRRWRKTRKSVARAYAHHARRMRENSGYRTAVGQGIETLAALPGRVGQMFRVVAQVHQAAYMTA